MSDIKFAQVAESGPKFLYHPVTKEKIYFRGAKESMVAKAPVEKRGMLVVTFFCLSDLALLEKRLEWMSHLKFKTGFDLLLVGDGDVDQSTLDALAEKHRPFFKAVDTRKILDGNGGNPWPSNVNSAFQKTARILRGEYGTHKFSWLPYSSWFNFESDTIPLKPDALEQVALSYINGKRPFWGYIRDTPDTSGKIHRHLNGAAVYPARKDSAGRWYNPPMMLAKNVPWDVAGMQDMTLCFGVSQEVYPNCFGTVNYARSGDGFKATQRLHDGTESQKTVRIPETAILFHGCKDGSLIDVLMGKSIDKKEVMPHVAERTGDEVAPEVPPSGMASKAFATIVLTEDNSQELLESQIRIDHRSGMKWKELMAKYKKSPKQLKAIIDA